MDELLKKIGETQIQLELIQAQKAQLIRKALEHLANGHNGDSTAAQTGEVETPTDAAAAQDQPEGSPI